MNKAQAKYYKKNQARLNREKDTIVKIGRKSIKALEFVTCTESAVEFGKMIKDNPHAIIGVQKAMEFWQDKYNSTKNQGQLIAIATRIQFCREALETANKGE